jgi:elongation factor Ts
MQAAAKTEEASLLDQKFIKDPTKTIRDYLTETIARLGENIVIRRFVRFEVGVEPQVETLAGE